VGFDVGVDLRPGLRCTIPDPGVAQVLQTVEAAKHDDFFELHVV